MLKFGGGEIQVPGSAREVTALGEISGNTLELRQLLKNFEGWKGLQQAEHKSRKATWKTKDADWVCRFKQLARDLQVDSQGWRAKWMVMKVSGIVSRGKSYRALTWADDDWETRKGLNKESVNVCFKLLMIISRSGTVHGLRGICGKESYGKIKARLQMLNKGHANKKI